MTDVTSSHPVELCEFIVAIVWDRWCLGNYKTGVNGIVGSRNGMVIGCCHLSVQKFMPAVSLLFQLSCKRYENTVFRVRFLNVLTFVLI